MQSTESRSGVRPFSRLTGMRAPGFVCITLGTMIMCLLLLQPVWNSVLMLHNPVFVYFVGKQLPSFIIAACICLVIVYVVTIVLFFRHSRKAAQSEQNILMITNVFATTLGALVLIISMPVRRSGLAVAGEILDKCQHGQKTHDLYVTYNRLVNLRRTAACASLTSVEDCEGFYSSTNTELLKAMEFKYQCSGWCSPPTLWRPQPPIAPTTGVSLLQLEFQHIFHEDRHPANPITRPWAFKDANINLPLLPQGPPGAGVVPTYVYPPALFSKSNFVSTCNGMSARDAQYFLVDTADELYYEGLYLMVISVGIGFLKLLGFCMKDNIFSTMKRSGYGSSAHEDSIQRYMSQSFTN